MVDLKIQSLQRAFSILDLFTKNKPEWTILEMTEKLGLPRGTIYRFVNDLEIAGFLTLNKSTKHYRLGFKLMEYGMTVLNSLDIRKIAFPHLDKLRKDTNENVNLGIIDKKEIIFLERLESERLFRMNFQVGSRVPIHCAAMGKLLLSFLPKEEQHKLIEKLELTKQTNQTILDKDILYAELKKIRARGYSISDREFIDEVRTIAVPIFNHSGIAIAACNVTGPYYRITDDVILKDILPPLYQAGKSISNDLGYRGEYSTSL